MASEFELETCVAGLNNETNRGVDNKSATLKANDNIHESKTLLAVSPAQSMIVSLNTLATDRVRYSSVSLLMTPNGDLSKSMGWTSLPVL